MSYNYVVYIWRQGDVEMMDFKKGLLALSLFGVFSSGHLFASASTLDRIEPQEPLPGFELDLVEYDTATYNGEAPQPRVATLLSSGVSRYVNHSNGQYYAKGATRVVESTTNKDLYHKTTVTLEKKVLFVTNTLVSASQWGTGEVWATTGTTPTAGTPHVYWDIK